jgi:hypothetical protein
LEKAVREKNIANALLESKNVAASGIAFLAFAEKEVENTTDAAYKADLEKVIREIKACKYSIV